ARDRDVPAVRQVAAGRQAHAHDGVAGLQEREVDGEVRGRARVRLRVRVVDPEHRLRAVDAQLLDAVDVLLALVVALPGVALTVLVREDGPGRRKYRTRHVVLGCNQADRVALPLLFGSDQLRDFRVDVGDRLHEGGVHVRSHTRSGSRVPWRASWSGQVSRSRSSLGAADSAYKRPYVSSETIEAS